MNTQVFSREYLQGIPEQRKQQAIRNNIQPFIQTVQQYAAMGKTSCLFEPQSVRIMQTCPPTPIPTTEEYITALQTIFPDCIIEYRETWTETSATSRVLKKGIVVDWS